MPEHREPETIKLRTIIIMDTEVDADQMILSIPEEYIQNHIALLESGGMTFDELADMSKVSIAAIILDNDD